MLGSPHGLSAIGYCSHALWDRVCFTHLLAPFIFSRCQPSRRVNLTEGGEAAQHIKEQL